MKLEELAQETFNSLYHQPPNATDLKEFAEKVLKQFVSELERNQQGVAWNSGFDSVIFADKSVDGNKSLRQIKEEYLGQESDDRDPDIA